MDLNPKAGYKNKCIDFAEDNNEKEEAKKNLNEFEMENDFEEEEGELNDVDEWDENDEEPDFMDNSGKIWNFACEILDERHLKKWCRKMGAIIVSKDEKLTRQYECSIEECPFQVTFLKSCSIVYTRNEHNYGEENTKNIQIKQEEVENNEQDHVDKHGNVWSFRTRIGKNYHKDIFRKEFGLSHIKKSKTHLYMCCQHRSPAGGKCRFTGIFLESNGCLYTRGEHEQHSKKRKHHKILVTIMRINIAEFGNLKKKLAKIFNPKYCTTNMDLQEFDQIKQH